MARLVTVDASMFDDIHQHLLTLLPPPRPREEWSLLFSSPWKPQEDRVGYALFEGSTPVAFMGLLFADRWIQGRTRPFCNVTSWVAREPYRSEASLLALQLRELDGHCITNLTPTPTVARVFRRLGFEPLETHRTVLLPAGLLRPGLGARGVGVSEDPADLESVLEARHREVFEAHRPFAHHVVAWDAGGYCYVVYTVVRTAVSRRARVHTVSDPRRFARWLPRLQRHWASTHGALSAEWDARFLDGVKVPLSVRRLRGAPRLFRPAGVDRREIDNLYSELVLLDLP